MAKPIPKNETNDMLRLLQRRLLKKLIQESDPTNWVEGDKNPKWLGKESRQIQMEQKKNATQTYAVLNCVTSVLKNQIGDAEEAAKIDTEQQDLISTATESTQKILKEMGLH